MKYKILALAILFAYTYSQTYNVGDIMSNDDQNQSFDVCYGEYNPTFSFSDLNGSINDDGKYYVSFIDMAATW